MNCISVLSNNYNYRCDCKFIALWPQHDPALSRICRGGVGGDIGAHNNKGGGGTAQHTGALFLCLGVKFYQVAYSVVSTPL